MFRLCPNLIRTDILLGVLWVAQGNLSLNVLEIEDGEHGLDDVHHTHELAFHLVGAAEDMGVILSERAHTGESVQLARLLVTIDGTKFGNAERQVFIRTGLPSENLTMVRTVHGLQHVFLSLLRSGDRTECIFRIVGVVTRCHIEVLTTNMRSDNFLITKILLDFAQHILQAETQVSSLWQPDGKTLTYTVGEHEELHLLANLAMVAFLGFLEHDEILVEHLFLGERNAIEALHLLALGISTPESTSHTGELHGLDETCGDKVRTAAKVGEVALRICGDGSVLEVLVDMLTLVGLPICGKLFQSIGLGHFATHNRLILASQL